MSSRNPDERQLEDLTPDEVAAVQAALTMQAAVSGRPTAPRPTIAGTTRDTVPAWLAVAPAVTHADGPTALPPAPASWFDTSGHLAAANHPALRRTPEHLVADPGSPRVIPVAGTLASSRSAAMRAGPSTLGRRRADALPTRALAAAAGVAATLGLIVVLVPPDTLVATGTAASADASAADPGGSTEAAGLAGDAITPSDVVETPAPSPSPLATKGAKAKATARPGSGNAATARPAAGTTKSGSGSGTGSGSNHGSGGGAAATPRPTAKATAAPTAKATPAPTPKPTPKPTPRPTPKPTPVPTAASGKP